MTSSPRQLEQPTKYFEKLWEVDMFKGKVAQTKKRCDSTFTF